MEKYVNQLLAQINQIILKRWRTCVPHYYEVGMRNEYLEPPKGWNEEDTPETDFDSQFISEKTTEEMETWLYGKGEFSMFYHFELGEQQFPPADRLTDEQLDKLVFALHRLWNAFNFTAVVPNSAPSRVVYPILLKRMLDSATVLQYGHSGIEFCDYVPEECVFGQYCDCKKYLEENEKVIIEKPVEERRADLDDFNNPFEKKDDDLPF